MFSKLCSTASGVNKNKAAKEQIGEDNADADEIRAAIRLQCKTARQDKVKERRKQYDHSRSLPLKADKRCKGCGGIASAGSMTYSAFVGLQRRCLKYHNGKHGGKACYNTKKASLIQY